MSEELIKRIVEKVGLTEEKAKFALEIFDDFRLEHGDEMYLAMLKEMSNLIATAERDGVSVTSLLEAMSRQPS
jgi:hypothetical protein